MKTKAPAPKPKKKRKTLRIVDLPYVSLEGKAAWGVCYRTLHKIELLSTLESFDYLTTLIHEMLHYCLPSLTEAQVEKISIRISNVIWERRYRRVAL
jgi:hypothetical protein